MTDIIEQYKKQGRLPWSPGYAQYKYNFLVNALGNEQLLEQFRAGMQLPDGYGPRLDERVVEYPWVVARLRPNGYFMDAGSTFNTPLLIEHPLFVNRRFLICTYETDWITLKPNISYLFNDLRDTVLRDNVFDSIVCISTLEHIGLGLDIKLYSAENPWPDADYESYKLALREFSRLLKPGGQLLLTVPFGKRENHGWLQQYDADGVEAIKEAFSGDVAAEQYYCYDESGWRSAAQSECNELHYYNIHAADDFDDDYAAAARGVVCLDLVSAK